jgi:hypothetical protein
MKPIFNSTPAPEPLDDLLAAALHGELTAAERAALDARLATDPAARAAYQETQRMHDLLEKNHREAQPDPAFEERMIAAVRRKARAEKEHRETAWESVMVLWRGLGRLVRGRSWPEYAGALAVLLVLGVVAFRPITAGIRKAKALGGRQEFVAMLPTGWASAADVPTNQEKSDADKGMVTTTRSPNATLVSEKARSLTFLPSFDTPTNAQSADKGLNHKLELYNGSTGKSLGPQAVPLLGDVPQGGRLFSGSDSLSQKDFLRRNVDGRVSPPAGPAVADSDLTDSENQQQHALKLPPSFMETAKHGVTLSGYVDTSTTLAFAGASQMGSAPKSTASPTPPATAEPSRKLIRNAQLDLEVKSYEQAVDDITVLTKADGGYVDSSSSQRGGNGKLQGTLVAKVLPENLDAFLLRLRGLGEVKNQSISTDDVTRAYYDTQARLDNSRLMEKQLQQLLQRDTGKVADLLQVERELERVRGDIESMQGQLKLYDFQVQYATVTIALAEKDLNQAAAYLLQEHDTFSLFARNVEEAFQQAKAAADTCQAEILSADLQHNAGQDETAQFVFSVPPAQIDAFLTRVRALGRVENFVRTTRRVANDGGDTGTPADQTRTEKDRVQVEVTIRADDESPRQQTQLAVASTGDIDAQARQAKDDAAVNDAAVTASSFDRAPDGTETAALTFRLPVAHVAALMTALEKLGRVESLTVARRDGPDQPAADDNAPAQIDLQLHNVPAVRFQDEPPRQQTQLAIVSTGDVDAQAQQVKADALQTGVAVTGSSFQRAPDGTEEAALTFRVPLGRAAAFTATLEKLGRVESLAVQRNDVPGASGTDPDAPAEISLRLHNEAAFVADDRGLWPTLRRTFGGGIAAFLGSVQTIGVIVAYLLPWAAALVLAAWVGRRIYVSRRKR